MRKAISKTDFIKPWAPLQGSARCGEFDALITAEDTRITQFVRVDFYLRHIYSFQTSA